MNKILITMGGGVLLWLILWICMCIMSEDDNGLLSAFIAFIISLATCLLVAGFWL